MLGLSLLSIRNRRRCWIRLKRSSLFMLFTSLILFLVTGVFLLLNGDYVRILGPRTDSFSRKGNRVQFFPDNILQKIEAEAVEERLDAQRFPRVLENKLVNEISATPSMEKTFTEKEKRRNNLLSRDVHVFYYGWYGNPRFDREGWAHWNHPYLPPWKSSDKKKYVEKARHAPPEDIGSNFYPQLGPYSSKDPEILKNHMKMIRDSGVGVLVFSWYPANNMDERALSSPDNLLTKVLNIALVYGVKVALHVEPYSNRNASNFRSVLEYVTQKYANHSAFYKRKRTPYSTKELPVYYIYDSYSLPAAEWQKLFSARGSLTVRDTPLDGIFFGLLVDFKHRSEIKRSKFDGFYTYFATNGFSYGSTWKNWKPLFSFAQKNSLIFVPSLGPGYKDVRIRSWNTVNTRERRKGLYYSAAWKSAISSGVKHFSITSFNEWHEGTQIEPAVPKTNGNFSYDSYEPNDPDFYLKQTANWVKRVCEEHKVFSQCDVIPDDH